MKRTSPESREGNCSSCGNYKVLQSSHALPHSFFKRVRRNHGKNLLGLSANENVPTIETDESFEEYLLCSQCEKLFNEKYDSYGVNVFTGNYGKSRRNESGVTFSCIDRKRLRLFVLSIIWRASISTHPVYKGVSIGEEMEDYLLNVFHEKIALRSTDCAVILSRLRDTSNIQHSLDELRDIFLLPVQRKTTFGESYLFIAGGFVLEIFMAGVPRKFRDKNGVLSGSSSTFLAPYAEFFDIPEVCKTISVSMKKEKPNC